MSQHAFCPHCDTKLKFKKLPQKTLDCPKCKQPIEPAHFQNAVEASVEEAPPADPVPPEPSEDAKTYSFSAPAPKPTPARSAVDDDLSERIERQSKPKKKKRRSEEEDEEDGSMITAGLSGLVGAAFFLIYGGMGWGITWMRIISFSPGFIFGTGVVLAVLSLLMLLAGIYEFIKDGFEATGEEKAFSGKAAIFVVAIAGLVPLIYFSQRGGDESADEPGNETAVASNNEGNATAQRAADSNQNPPVNNSNNRRATTDNSVSSSRRTRQDQNANEEPEPPSSLTVLIWADAQSQELVDFATLLKPRESGTSAETVRQADTYLTMKYTPAPDIGQYVKGITSLGFKLRKADKGNAVVEFDPFPVGDVPFPERARYINTEIFKALPEIPYDLMWKLDKNYRWAEYTPLAGSTGNATGTFDLPNLTGSPDRYVRGGRYSMESSTGETVLSKLTLFSHVPTKSDRFPQEVPFGAKEGYVLTGIKFAHDGVMHGFQPLYTRYSDGELDSSDSYEGDWEGLHEGLETTTLGGHEQLVLGMIAYRGSQGLSAAGMVLDPPPMKVEDHPHLTSDQAVNLPFIFPGGETSPLVGYKTGRCNVHPTRGQPGDPVVGGNYRIADYRDAEHLMSIDLYSGKRAGPGRPATSFVSKPGYVLTGFTFAYDDTEICGFRPHYTRYTEGTLDTSDTYLGEWLGTHEDLKTSTLGGHERPVLGFYSYGQFNYYHGIGLILQGTSEPN
jgi:hypothetical protein